MLNAMHSANSGPPEASAHYALVARAIDCLRTHQPDQPGLPELARALGSSESHLQRVFSAWAGVSPKRFLQILTRQYAIAALRDQASVLEASLSAGLSGPGRLHDLTVSCDAMTPGEIASGGAGLRLHCGVGETPFGSAFIAWGERGICHLSFQAQSDGDSHADFRREWPRAAIQRDDEGARQLLAHVFSQPLQRGRLHVLLRGTNFQVKVWEALLSLAPGDLASYQQLGALAGTGEAHRAVGSALARNRIAYLIPCHRVIRQSGDWGNYRWGLERKLAMHIWEAQG
jgi:AraC family transcriptional regulator of adaptative response/methylated-DNA-[protein]-cysteine methyltransferase